MGRRQCPKLAAVVWFRPLAIGADGISSIEDVLVPRAVPTASLEAGAFSDPPMAANIPNKPTVAHDARAVL